VVESADFARNAALAVVTTSSPWTPVSLVAVDLTHASSRVLDVPAEARFANLRSGSVEPWSFTASSGVEVDGRVYLPPDFDPKKKWPCIVYYYGGTAPVGREFGGRYPKEWWAAEGYVVYVPQPSGATGYGQLRSAKHVNDWGETTAAEVIEGTKQFLASHAYVDPKRVGCIGASYGGFLTMQLVTKTDLYAAAVSHAGISSLAGYWGEGYWGYTYSSVATAESFPWNRRDVYVDKSPIFHADKVKTPILLTHGTEDTNVPTLESDAFFTALKLVGAPVEYVQVEGLDHLIVDHAKRVVWSRTIVAWFDRYLKGEPEWWNDLWPDRAAK
jgi:dipeptidyl aminopeptidase/acylaminoacyl peptidase